jgi:hypothetical protein
VARVTYVIQNRVTFSFFFFLSSPKVLNSNRVGCPDSSRLQIFRTTHVTVLDLILSAPSRVHDPKAVNFFFLVNAQSFQPDPPRQPRLEAPRALMASNVFARLMPPSTFRSNHVTQGTSMLRDPSPVRDPKPGNVFF